MKITVTAKPNKKQVFVKQVSPTEYVVSVREPAKEGKANKAIIRSLSDYFGVPQSAISLISGQTSHHKVFIIPDHLANFEVLPKQKPLF